jgi:hypothetical protein
MILSILFMFLSKEPLPVKMMIVKCFEIILMKNYNMFHHLWYSQLVSFECQM